MGRGQVASRARQQWLGQVVGEQVGKQVRWGIPLEGIGSRGAGIEGFRHCGLASGGGRQDVEVRLHASHCLSLYCLPPCHCFPHCGGVGGRGGI